jgi:type I restriction enzyme S subunit
MVIASDYQETDFGIFPKDWSIKYIPEIILKRDGIKIGPFGSQLKRELLTNDGYKVYGQENVYEKNMTTGNRYINKEHFERLKGCELKSGDFIISMMGTIGKTMIVPEPIQEGIMDSHLLRLRLNQDIIYPPLLQHYFSSTILLNQISQLSVGGIMDGLSSKIIKNVHIHLPPTKSEQTTIATALSNAGTLISSLEKLIEKKRAIKHGAMQQLLNPKDGWMMTKLGEIASIQRGASPRPIDSPIWFDESSKVGWVRISDVTKSVKYLFETAQKLSEEGIKNSRYVQAGELIMSICATIGRPILTAIDVCIHDGFVVFYKPMVDKEFLYYSLTYIEEEWAKTGQTGSQMNLNTDIIQTRTLAFPKEIREQRLIVETLSDMDDEILVLNQKLSKYKMLKQGMMQELLTGKTRLI